MIRLNRVRWMMNMAQIREPNWFWFGRGVWGLKRWLDKHGFVLWEPSKFGDKGRARLSEKGRAALKQAIDEHERHKSFPRAT